MLRWTCWALLIFAICSYSYAATTQPPPAAVSKVICETCECKDGLVDCRNKKLNNTFTDDDWLGVSSPKVIDFDSNNLGSLVQFPELKSLVELRITNCNLTNIKKSTFKYLQFMKILNLSHNNLTSDALKPEVFEGLYMPEEYEPLRSMRILYLSYNNLHSLHQDVFEHLPELEELYLNENPLSVIDHVTVVAISSLLQLKVLNLSGCQLKSLPEYFLHTPIHLARLDLSSNQLQIVPQPLEEAKNLKYLSLNNNPIKYIEKKSQFFTAFPNMVSLEELEMSHMPVLEAIREEAMSGLVSLKILRLSYNPALTIVHPAVLQSPDPVGEGTIWPPLEELYISHNNISVLDSMLVGRWDSLKAIDVRENPYLCDCDTQWMVSNLAPMIRAVSPNMTSDIICREPIEMRGKSIIHLEEIHRHMRCADAYGAQPERDGAWLIAILIGVLITIPMVMWIVLAYRRGLLAACGLRASSSTFERSFYTRTDTEEFM